MSLHQTYINDPSCVLESPPNQRCGRDALGSSPELLPQTSESEVESSPTVLGPTPPSKKIGDNKSNKVSKTSRRRLLPSFSDRMPQKVAAVPKKLQMDDNLADQVPRWELEYR